MSCQRFQIDLSRCLDGRLPSARRAAVMTHVDRCPNCEQVWADMQAAQSLVFGLRQPRVGPKFRDQLWERIHSGEGAPEVLLQEPVTTGSKVRYGLVGAAAAAAFLFTLQILTRSDTPVSDGADQVADNPVDHRLIPDNPPIRDVIQIDRSSDPFGGSTMAASQLAHVAAQRVTSAAKQLRSKRDRILGGVPLDRPLRERVNDYVRTIDGGLMVLDRLHEREFVTFAPASRDCLVSVRNSLNLDADPDRRSYNLVRTLTNCSLDRLDQQLKYTISAQQIPQQEQVLFSMLMEQRFRSILTEQLQVIQRRGPVFFLKLSGNTPEGVTFLPMGDPQQINLQLVPMPSTSWNLGFRFAAPSEAPEAARKQLTKREPRK